MKKISILIIIAISAALIIGSGCVTDTGQKTRSYEVVWTGTPPADHKLVETELSHQIAPYSGAGYDNVTVSVSEKDGVMRLRVSAASSACRYPDLYEFVYNDHLVRTGYLLEAIPETTRQDAIGTAMQNPEIADALLGGAGVPTVKRILPETSAKFYAAKTLLSVTWTDASVSALVDMDSRSVVETWRGNE